MGTLFRNIYSWFRRLFGDNLYNYLKGFDCNYEEVNTNQFFIIGLVTLIIVALMCCLFYFIKRGKFNGFVSWLVILSVTAMASFCYGFGVTYAKQNDMPYYVIYGVNNVQCPIDEGTGTPLESCDCSSMVPYEGSQPQVTTKTFLSFGLANAIVAIGMFFVLSIIFKRFSVTAKHTPWKSIWPKQRKKQLI